VEKRLTRAQKVRAIMMGCAQELAVPFLLVRASMDGLAKYAMKRQILVHWSHAKTVALAQK